MQLLETTGHLAVVLCTQLGSIAFFLGKWWQTLLTAKFHSKQLFLQMKRIGVDSTTIIFLSSLSSGFALALQTYAGLSRIGGEEMIGAIVAWGMTRELGPVLTAIMVTGRSGSSIAAELGTMKITEQIDALRTLRIDPFQYLVVPRVVAGALILPFLTVFAMLLGITGGYLFTLNNMNISPQLYLANIQNYLTFGDIASGLIKSCFFGFTLAFVGCYEGLHTTGGARGVGKATTNSVVIGSIIILIANYFLSSLLFRVGL